MYRYDSRVRFSELDAEGKLSITGIINYLQDCSTFQSEDLGLGIEYLRQLNMVWVVNSWQIEVLRFPKLGERITIGTRPYLIRGFLGHRNFYILDAEGNYLVKATAIWSLLSTQTGHPVNVTQEMVDGYVLAEKIDMEYLPRKISIPKDGKELDPIEILPSNLDSNHHVNNGQYVVLAMGCIAQNKEAYTFHHVRTEYRQQARLGDKLYPRVSKNEKGYYIVELNDAEGKPVSIVELGE